MLCKQTVFWYVYSSNKYWPTNQSPLQQVKGGTSKKQGLAKFQIHSSTFRDDVWKDVRAFEKDEYIMCVTEFNQHKSKNKNCSWEGSYEMFPAKL